MDKHAAQMTETKPDDRDDWLPSDYVRAGWTQGVISTADSVVGRWTADVYARDGEGNILDNTGARDPEAVSWSAIGALRAWLLGEEDSYAVVPKNNSFLDKLQELHGIRSISEWNNAEGQTDEEVADTLESVERALGYRG